MKPARSRFRANAPSVALALGLFASQAALAIADEAPSAEPPPQAATISEHSYALYNPRLPQPLQPLLPIGSGLCLIFGIYAWRRYEKPVVPYILAAGIGAAMLADPRLITSHFSPVPDEVILAVDQTASQSIGNRAAMTQEVQASLIQKLQTLPNINIRVVTIGPPADSADDRGTRLFTALDSMSDVDWDNVAGIIALTDGQIADIPEKPPFGKGVPFYAMISGKDGEIDRLAQLDAAPRFGLVGEDQVIRFEIKDTGRADQAPQTVNVHIIGNNEEPRTIQVKTGEAAEARVRIKNSGENIFSFEVDPLLGEVTSANNSFVATIEGTRESFNVLIIGGRITPDTMTLRRVFKADPDSNLIHTMSLSLPDSMDDTPNEKKNLVRPPLEEVFGDALKRFNLIIFDRFEDVGILPPSYLDGIRNYIEQGGALLNIAGPETTGPYSIQTTSLASILPATPIQSIDGIPYKPRLTPLGTRHPVTRSLDGAGSDKTEPGWGEWVRVIDSKVSPSGQVVMQTPDGKPLLVLSEVGKGRVATLQSDSFSLWERGLNGGGPAGPLLRHLAHWAMKDPAFSDDSLNVIAGKDGLLHIERHTVSEGTPAPVNIKSPDGRFIQETFNKQSAPGLWTAQHAFSDPGVYQLVTTDDKKLTAFVSVGNSNTPEFAFPVSTSALLQPIADATGGAVFRMVSAETGQVSLPDVRQIDRGDWKGKTTPDQITLVQGGAKVLQGLDRQPLIPGWLGWTLMAASLAWGYSGWRTMARTKTAPAAHPKSLKIG